MGGCRVMMGVCEHSLNSMTRKAKLVRVPFMILSRIDSSPFPGNGISVAVYPWRNPQIRSGLYNFP
jgi:hypothetical protein